MEDDDQIPDIEDSLMRVFTPLTEDELNDGWDDDPRVTLLAHAVRGCGYADVVGLDDDALVALLERALADPQQAPIAMMMSLGLSAAEALDFAWDDVLLLPGGRLVIRKWVPEED